MNRPTHSTRQQCTARSSKSHDGGKEEQRYSAAEKNKAKCTAAAATQTTARSDGVAAGSRSCRGERTPRSARSDGVSAGSGSCQGERPPDSARSEPRTSRSFTARSSEGSRGTPRETGRTTTSMTMSTARAEATLAVLEAERAQLERRLKKENHLRLQGTVES
eukprot:jgi/Undpi1/2965/HiC_scaffold_14.g06342.m1